MKRNWSKWNEIEGNGTKRGKWNESEGNQMES